MEAKKRYQMKYIIGSCITMGTIIGTGIVIFFNDTQPYQWSNQYSNGCNSRPNTDKMKPIMA